MASNKSQSNESFDFLAHNSDFLNLILNSMPACVLLLNSNMELQAYNNALTSIFSNKQNEELLYHRCGEVIGCAYQVDEEKNCGTTSQCKFCELRLAAMETYTNNVVVYKENIVRPFYNHLQQKEAKTLQFSTRIFNFNSDKYLVLIIEDVTKYNC